MTNDDQDFDDSDEELELEPVDPEILEYQRQQVQRKTRELEDRVDVEELFEGIEQEDAFTAEDLKQFRFSIRHLLILTAVTAVVLTIAKLTDGCMAIFISAVIALASGWWLVTRKEKQQALERQQRKERMKARIAAQRASEDGTPESGLSGSNDESPSYSRSIRDFKFNFSLKQLLGVMAVVAFTLGLIRIMGGTEYAAMLLGFIALGGLLLHALGLEPPPIVVLGWWLLLFLYIVIGLASMVIATSIPLPRQATYYCSSDFSRSNQIVTLFSSTSSGTEPPPSTTS